MKKYIIMFAVFAFLALTGVCYSRVDDLTDSSVMVVDDKLFFKYVSEEVFTSELVYINHDGSVSYPRLNITIIPSPEDDYIKILVKDKILKVFPSGKIEVEEGVLGND